VLAGSSLLLLLAVILVLGTLGGYLARCLRLPAIVGQVLVGMLLGQTGVDLLSHSRQEVFAPVVSLALGLVAVTVGGHLEFRRLHNALRRIAAISACEITAVFWLVLAALLLANPLDLSTEARWPVSMLLASMATSTSPISTLHIIKEKQARGLLVKTALAVLAINNLLTILAFEVLHGVAVTTLSLQRSLPAGIGMALAGEAFAVGLGAAVGWLLVFYSRFVTGRVRKGTAAPRQQAALIASSLFTGFLVAISFTSGLCGVMAGAWGGYHFRPSPILANMAVGLVLANRSTLKDEILNLFGTIQEGIFVLFFVLAGSHFHVSSLAAVWPAVLVFFVFRAIGMAAGGWLGGWLGGATRRTAAFVGSLLLTQGAIAISLTMLLRSDPVLEPFAEAMTATVVAACVLSELVGPLIMGWVLDRTGETRCDRVRLIEFLQEEYILPRLRARDKWEAIDALCHFLCRTHDIEESPVEIREAIRKRERSMPTGIGKGVAVPHAHIRAGRRIHGVLATLETPVDFGAPDGEPAWLVVMVATPEALSHQHLDVIAALSRMMRQDSLREAVRQARTAERIHEILETEEAGAINYFLET
jgi:mannitol/fructose-specific phosphotransferase system IIA component (Ntr-type)/Kef-type K+ transport system membrane component KefB